MSNIQFRIELGNQTSLQSGQISIFEIRETAAPMVGNPTQISNNSGIIEIPINQEFCYAILKINEYNNEVSNERTLQLLSVFPATAQEIVFSEQLTVANIFCFS